jgi:hypothetical protein
MPSPLHELQSEAAARWLRKNGFPVVAVNVFALGSRERVDAIGWRHSASVLIESKVSRSDFHCDRNKPERHSGGVGLYRFYITPPNLVSVSELPAGWGLLYFDGKKVTEIKRPKGNAWPSFGVGDSEWMQHQHLVDKDAEQALLFSVARKLAVRK